MAEVKFYSCTQTTYDGITSKNADALYFTTDTHKIYKGTQLYGGDISGLAGAMHFKGIVSVLPTDFTNYNPGDVIIVGNKEYVCVETTNVKSWHELGDESIYAVKGDIKNSDIAADANIEQSKINNLINSLDSKQLKSNMLRIDTVDTHLNSDIYTDIFAISGSILFDTGFTGTQIKTFYINSGVELKSGTNTAFSKINVEFTEKPFPYTVEKKMYLVGFTADNIPLFVTEATGLPQWQNV